MNIIKTVYGKIKSFDYLDYLLKKEMVRLEKDKENRLRYKKKHGLKEEERLSPIDSMCNHDYIEKVEIVSKTPTTNDQGKPCTDVHQLVTYIDGSTKEFNIQTTLSELPLPEKKKNRLKVKKNVL